jgi:hypothetical protein
VGTGGVGSLPYRSRRCPRSSPAAASCRPAETTTSTASDRRRGQAVTRREEELADGFAEMRFAGFVTVSAREGEDLERASGEIEHAGQLARLEFQRMYGEQEAAFTNTLPVCRGLR